MNQSMNEEDDCRTALATPGLLKSKRALGVLNIKVEW